MPLPPNSAITLQGHSALTSKPKVAMIVRMTEETLDALANLAATDRMDFEFGDRPAIYIQGKSFPMRYNKEKDNQELFIRTTGARLNNPPLKLNANVIGKFLIERELSDRVVKQIHNATAEAAKQKNERKTIMLDAPPSLTAVTTAKVAPKKKTATRTTPKSTPIIVTKNYTTQTPQPPKESAPSTSSIPPELVNQYRQRLVHYLALGPALQADAVKAVGGVEADHETRTKIIEILNDVAELELVPRKAASASANTKWQLKPQSWLQVRPYQYPDYTENVRTSVARQARQWLSKTLKIPETDEAWNHIRFRGAGSSGGAANTAQRPANVAMSTTAKKPKTSKTKAQDITAKSEVAAHESERARAPPASERLQVPTESRPPSIRPEKGKQRESEKEEGELSASETPPQRTPVPIRRSLTPVRRPPPISTDRRLEPPPSRPSGANTPTMPPPASPRPPMGPPSSSAAPPKRTGPVDARTSKRPPPEQSERGHALPPILPPATGRSTPVQVQVKKEVVTVKKERPAVPGHRASGSVTLGDKERAAIRRERDESDRENVRTAKKRDRDESDRESLRGVKRRERDESDRESVRAPKRERVSDLESLDGRDRAREKVRTKELAAKRRDRELERANREKEGLRERERQESVRERPLATTTTKVVKKRKEIEEDSGEESSDWGYEDRRPSRKPAAVKVKAERDSPAPVLSKPSSSLKVSRKERDPSPPPARKVKREVPPMASKSVSSSTVKVKTEASTPVAPRPTKKEVRDDRDRERERSTSTKPSKRKRSPIYTSSEDEEEDPRPKKIKKESKAPPAPPPTASTESARPRASRPAPPPASSSSTSNSTSAAATPIPHQTKIPHPSVIASKIKDKTPRDRYKALYPEYIGAMHRLVLLKNKYEAYIVKHENAGQSSASASGDSGDEDEEFMTIEELQALKAHYSSVYSELESILQAALRKKARA